MTAGPTTARIVRLRVVGFKSFAEPATIEILPGLTGIVGPNGCGKSNVAEALRWAMGEANARSLRGGEMDDVIFAGTATRPSRNLAEVTLTLEGGEALPAPFTGQPELQVVRRIERGVGSGYRVNGRDVRARDIQTLFADLASGARSSAMVSQGRVGAIVNARPDDRRMVLEEAAGITGLHARRAEAETKLRVSEQNLERAVEQHAGIEAQLAHLQRQAEEARRYRAVCDSIQETEAALLSLGHARALEACRRTDKALVAARDAVVQAAATESATGAEAAEATGSLPKLRDNATAARIALDHARTAQHALAADAARAQDALAAASARCGQIGRDMAHATAVQRDAADADARLAAEAERLTGETAAAPARLDAVRAEAAYAAAAAEAAEAAATLATEHAAAQSSRSHALTALLDQATARARRADAALTRLQAERTRTAVQSIDPARVAAARQQQEAAEAAMADARMRLNEAEAVRAAAMPQAAAAREASNRADAAHITLAAEIRALSEILAVRDGERWPPMLDQLDVPAGMEAAIGAALGEELAAAADPAAGRHWRDLPAAAMASLPGQALDTLVDGPAALARALQAVGVVADDAAGDAGQHALLPGQSLVSAAGAMWRWDGYTVRAGTPSAATVRLQQRNRLTGLQARLRDAATTAETARNARVAADAAERSAAAAEAQARPAQREAEQRAAQSRQAATALQTQAAAALARLSELDEQIVGAQPEAIDAAAALAGVKAQRAAAPDDMVLRQALHSARIALAAARSRVTAANQALDAAIRDDDARMSRSRILMRERDDWRMRAADAAGRVADLAARDRDARADHSRLAATPDELARTAATANEALRTSEAAYRQSSAALHDGERRAAALTQAAQSAIQALSNRRESLVRAEGSAATAMAALDAVLARVTERFGTVLPDAPSDLTQGAEDRARSRLDRLIRERDAIGLVNLRAEIELAALAEAAAAIALDRDELATAIAKLRGRIGHQNREGRERLSAVFQQVDRQFQALFARMFGGGRAHLALVGSDDPLVAGLEIYAQPPGKKLSALSLLSGGEQALTALSLIFAVFRCNPAPICVLDEVDAPLDDANVDRFCALLADMAHETGTRFLVVTHHPLTMARMDRLYGVTMHERGVSRLLSVDLGAAVAMTEAIAAE